MYAESIVTERLDIAEEELGYRPIYHTTSEVDQFVRKLDAAMKLDAQGRPYLPRELTAGEFRFIENERVLCQCDAIYWLTRYAWLSDENNNAVRFKFRGAQRILMDVIMNLEASRAAIELLIGKGRQQYITTIIQLLAVHRILFYTYVNCFTASADRDKSAEMARKAFFAYDHMPWWLKPKYSRRVEGVPGLLEFDTIDSRMTIVHGSGSARSKGAQRTGIARGTTPTVYHLCLAASTLVRVSDSHVLPIKEIRAAEQTIGLSGELTKVKKIWKSPRKDEMTSEVSVWGTPSKLSCTRDHKVLTESGWKVAAKLTNKDWLIYPVRQISEMDGPIRLNWYEKYKQKPSGHTDVEPCFEFGRLAGLYLAEGTILRTRTKSVLGLIYTLHQREVETVEDWIGAVFAGTQRESRRRQTSKTAQVYLSDRGFAQWLSEWFGEKDNKRVPDLVWSLGREVCRGLVYGYLFGDGHFASRDSSVYATSIRVALPIGIRELIASLGYGWCQIAYREAGLWYNRNCAAAWIMTVCGTTANRIREDFGFTGSKIPARVHDEHWHWSQGRIAVEVESIGDGYSVEFYDLEVAAPDHTFLTVCGIVHNSEVSSFPDPEEQIEAAIFRSVHASPKVLGVLESTFSGDKGWFPEKYKYGKSNPLARHKSLFFSWPCAREIYPTTTWWKTYGPYLPPGWKPADKVLEQILKAELFIRSSTLLVQQLGPNWVMPIEQQWFYHVSYTEAERSGTLPTFIQEMPCDDIEAMQSSYDSVFGHEVIEVCHSNREKKYDVYGFCGQAIDERFEPDSDEIDYDQPRVCFNHTTPRGDVYRWEMIPLKYELFEGATGEDHERGAIENKLFVFRQPEPGRSYSIGADSSSGIGHDASVVSVNLVGEPGTPDVQAAEFRSHTVGHVELFAFILPIALMYKGRQTDINSWPKFAVEQLLSVGDVCQNELRKLGYPAGRMHRFARYDGVEMKHQTNKLGWFTTSWSRPILVGHIVHAVRNGWYLINSPWTIEECRQFEIHYTESGKEKQEHAKTSWDDGIFASAISYFIVHDMDSLAQRSKRQFHGPSEQVTLPPIDLTPNRSGYLVNPSSSFNRQVSMDEIVRGHVGLERFRH